MIIDFTSGIVRTNMDEKTASRFYGFAFTLFVYIVVANPNSESEWIPFSIFYLSD